MEAGVGTSKDILVVIPAKAARTCLYYSRARFVFTFLILVIFIVLIALGIAMG